MEHWTLKMIELENVLLTYRLIIYSDPHLTSCDPTWPHMTPHDPMWHHMTPGHLLWSHATPNFSYRRQHTSQSNVSQRNQVNFKMIPLGGAVSKQEKYKAVYSPFDQDKVRSRKRHKITKNSKNSQNLSHKIFANNFFVWNYFWKNSRNFSEKFFFEIVNSVNISFFDKWFFHFNFFFVKHFERFWIHVTLNDL